MQRIVLFDGVCHFCDASVQFIIKRDPAAHFSFASLQSEQGQRCIEQYNIDPDEDSVILIEGEKVYTQSSAALHIVKKLDGLWHLLFVFILIPPPIRNFCYRIFANNRYRWFGKKDEACSLPTPEERKRFL